MEIANEGHVALEVKLSFALPAGVLTRLGLLVSDKTVEAENEEKRKIAKFFKRIVDDKVRPKDPALLEHVAGSRFSLTLFPVPPKGRRRAVFAYDEALGASAGITTYRLPHRGVFEPGVRASRAPRRRAGPERSFERTAERSAGRSAAALRDGVVEDRCT